MSAFRDDERVVLTISNRSKAGEDFEGVSLSLPRVVGAGGIVRMKMHESGEMAHECVAGPARLEKAVKMTTGLIVEAGHVASV